MLLVVWSNHFENYKRKTHKVHKNKVALRYFNYVPIGNIKFDKHKKFISKGLSKYNFDPSKVHNYHLVKVSKKMISHVILSFHSLTHS